MKSSKRCPRCEGRAFFVVDPVKSPNYEFSNALEPLGLTGFYGESGETSFLGAPKKARQIVELEAWVCEGCGYAELYAKDLALLAAMAGRGDGVRRVQGG
ncbi:MAG: hypothetical protein KC420_14420 [Myxococcales bacterium]|nr:hypothetical protein [Myxococcales bacterium]MCB9570057.1 hypothetical protein [Myxococcales bacterium]MCB9701906.1 hypothetical protein [Myxococcales bacterium]